MSVPNQQHVFYLGTDGHINHMHWDAFTARLYAEVWTLRVHAPLAAGDPATLATPGQQHVFYRGLDRHIHHIVWVAGKRRLYRDVWTLRAGAPLADGDPVTMESPGQQHVFYRGPGGTVCHVFWDFSANQLFFDDWTAQADGPPAAGTPATLVTAGQQHVFYRGMSGGIQHIFWDAASGSLRHDDWTSGARAPLAVGNVATMATDGQQHVFYRGDNGAINHILWAPQSGTLHHDDWTARAHAPTADGDPATMVTVEGQQHVFYRGAGGEINHIFWDPSSRQLRFDEWTSRTQAGLAAAGVPATLVFSGQQHVFYRGSGGDIDHILWDPSSNSLGFDDWTSRANAPTAAGNPATLLSSDAPTDYTWKILPLGDSITEGFPGKVGGYRVRLFATAAHWGKRITFVGRLWDDPPDQNVEGVLFPRSHEGHSGMEIDYIASIVPDALKSEPDIILLMIGTNDILATYTQDSLKKKHRDEAPDRLAALLKNIIAADVGALIVVAQIPPLPELPIEVTKYNEGVAVVVRKLADAGERVLLADMHTGFPLSLLSPPPDNRHPNQQGYEHIAAVWYAAIDTTLT